MEAPQTEPMPEQQGERFTPTLPSPAPPPPASTDPRGLGVSDEPGVRELVLAMREQWETWRRDDAEWKHVDETWKTGQDARATAMVGGLKLLDARQVVLESDFRQLRVDTTAAQAAADAARLRADTAHATAGRTAQDHDAEKESLLAALTETRGKLESATKALTNTDEELKAMIAQAAKDSAGAAIREVVGKNPKVVAALGAMLLVAAQILSQRFVAPAAPPPPPVQMIVPAPAPAPMPLAKPRMLDPKEGTDL